MRGKKKTTGEEPNHVQKMKYIKTHPIKGSGKTEGIDRVLQEKKCRPPHIAPGIKGGGTTKGHPGQESQKKEKRQEETGGEKSSTTG